MIMIKRNPDAVTEFMRVVELHIDQGHCKHSFFEFYYGDAPGLRRESPR